MSGWMNDIRWQPVQWGRDEKDCAPLISQRRSPADSEPIDWVFGLLVVAIYFAVLESVFVWIPDFLTRLFNLPREISSPDAPPLGVLRTEYLQGISAAVAGEVLLIMLIIAAFWGIRRKGRSAAMVFWFLATVSPAVLVLIWPKLVNLVFVLRSSDNLFDPQMATTTWQNLSAYQNDPIRSWWIDLAFPIFIAASSISAISAILFYWRSQSPKAPSADSQRPNLFL